MSAATESADVPERARTSRLLRSRVSLSRARDQVATSSTVSPRTSRRAIFSLSSHWGDPSRGHGRTRTASVSSSAPRFSATVRCTPSASGSAQRW